MGRCDTLDDIVILRGCIAAFVFFVLYRGKQLRIPVKDLIKKWRKRLQDKVEDIFKL